MLKKTRLNACLTLAFGSVLGVGVSDVLAQATERIEITGSLIRRIDAEQALPVTTLKADELTKSGVTNAENVVKFITQQQGGTVTSGSVSGTNGAASYADLRSLGAGRTLVLLNGKRVVPNPFSSLAVDLNTLPMGAIERVETLSDGASSTYGTDAIAGVINFITRKSYTGITVGATTQITQAGGGDISTGSVLAGFGDMAKQGFNIFGAINLRKQESMRGTDRDFSVTSYIPARGYNALSPTTFPANYSQPGTVTNANPTLPVCAPPTSLFANDPVVGLGTNRCGADTQQFTKTVPDQDQQSLFLRGSLNLGRDHQASLEYFHSKNIVSTQIAPSPEGGLSMPPTSPYYPGNGITPNNPALDRTLPISIAWRTVPLGARQGEQENNTKRAVAQLEGTLAGWDYQTALLWSNATVVNTFLNGYPMTQPLRNGVSGTNGAPWLNPFGEQSAAGMAYLQANQVLGEVQNGEGTLQSFSFTASRPLFKLGGGEAMVGVAAEFRKEEMIYRTDVPKVSQAASSGLAGSGALRVGDRDVKAIGLELTMPFFKGFELGLSVRHDQYSDFGNTTNPKLQARWQAANNLLFRGSVNTGFVAPTLTQLYSPQATTFTATRFNDPVLCPGGTPTGATAVPSRDCGIQFQRLTGGNPGLTPEESKAWTVGVVFAPAANLTVALDYWYYYVKNSIGTITENSIFADPVKYAALFVRCSGAGARAATIGACNTPPGDPLAYILNTNLNLGDYNTRGLDVQVNWSGATPYGRLNLSARATHVNQYKFQEQPNGAWFNPLGNYNPQFGGPVIRYQQVTNIGLDRGAWNFNLSNRFMKGYRDQNNVPAAFANNVADYSLYDLSVTWKGVKGLTLQAGVLNLLDKDPPFTNQVSRFQARAYDDRFHNPLGRTWQLSAKYEF